MTSQSPRLNIHLYNRFNSQQRAFLNTGLLKPPVVKKPVKKPVVKKPVVKKPITKPIKKGEKIPAYKLRQKAAGYMLAAANADARK